jgi:hypothetical protein
MCNKRGRPMKPILPPASDLLRRASVRLGAAPIAASWHIELLTGTVVTVPSSAASMEVRRNHLQSEQIDVLLNRIGDEENFRVVLFCVVKRMRLSSVRMVFRLCFACIIAGIVTHEALAEGGGWRISQARCPAGWTQCPGSGRCVAPGMSCAGVPNSNPTANPNEPQSCPCKTPQGRCRIDSSGRPATNC